MNTYLCIEDGERFTVQAKDLDDARDKASMWGAEVIRKLTAKEVANLPKPKPVGGQ